MREDYAQTAEEPPHPRSAHLFTGKDKNHFQRLFMLE